MRYEDVVTDLPLVAAEHDDRHRLRTEALSRGGRLRVRPARGSESRYLFKDGRWAEIRSVAYDFVYDDNMHHEAIDVVATDSAGRETRIDCKVFAKFQYEVDPMIVLNEGAAVRRQKIWRNWGRKLADARPRLGVDVRRRSCGTASGDVRWSVA